MDGAAAVAHFGRLLACVEQATQLTIKASPGNHELHSWGWVGNGQAVRKVVGGPVDSASFTAPPPSSWLTLVACNSPKPHLIFHIYNVAREDSDSTYSIHRWL